MMAPLEVLKYVRKELIVDVVKVTEDNMELAAQWCNGVLKQDGRSRKVYVKVDVLRATTERLTQAFVGDYILFADKGYKVFTESALNRVFEPKPDNKKIKLSEIEPLDYNEETLQKVFGALVAVGLSGNDAQVAISTMQNDGILFRERGKRYVPGEPQKEYNVVRHGPDDAEVFEENEHPNLYYTKNKLFDDQDQLIPTDADGRPYLTIDDYHLRQAQEAGTSTLLHENLNR